MASALKNEGQIKFLKLPAHWLEVEDEDEGMIMHGPQNKAFYLESNQEVRLNFFYRGFPLAPQYGAAFQKILGQEAHQLSAEELESIAMLVREASEPEYVELKVLRTESLRNRMILVVEGLQKETNKYDLGLYIDADGSGCIVQEFHYNAPADLYLNHRPEVLAILSSVEWR